MPLSNPLQGDVNNYTHYGHETSDGLDDNLMEGNVGFATGKPYNIEEIDLALMQDLGLTVINSSNGWMLS